MKVYLIIENSFVDGNEIHGVYLTKEIAINHLKELYNKEYHYYTDEEEDNEAFNKHLKFESTLKWKNNERFEFRYNNNIHTIWEIHEEEVIEE